MEKDPQCHGMVASVYGCEVLQSTCITRSKQVSARPLFKPEPAGMDAHVGSLHKQRLLSLHP